MPNFVPTSLDVMLPLVIAKLQNDVIFEDPSLVYLSDDPDEDDAYFPPASQYATVVAGSATRADPWEGPVRAFLHVEQELIAVVWTRLATDIAARGSRMLTDPAGILRKVFQVANALHGYQVSDIQGNLYSTQPIVYQREDRATRKRKDEAWSRRRAYFSLFYMMATPIPAVTHGVS